MDTDETSVSSHKSEGGPQPMGGGEMDDVLFLDQNLTSQNISPTYCIFNRLCSLNAYFIRRRKNHSINKYIKSH